MRKTALLCVLSLILGCALGLSRSQMAKPEGGASVPPAILVPQADTSRGDAPPPTDSNAPLLMAGTAVLQALKGQDIETLSALTDPERGVTFTPYSTVDARSDLTFLPDQLAQAAANHTQYIWGHAQGSGEPIELTLSDYLKRFVYNADYLTAPFIGVNHVIASGNSLENVSQAYPDGYFIEYYFPGLDAANSGLDWCALKTVFHWSGGAYRLTGLIHSEWTI